MSSACAVLTRLCPLLSGSLNPLLLDAHCFLFRLVLYTAVKPVVAVSVLLAYISIGADTLFAHYRVVLPGVTGSAGAAGTIIYVYCSSQLT